jgi:hypothetical protein
MSKVWSYRTAYSEEVFRDLASGPDGKHGGIIAMLKASDAGEDSFTYNGRTYVRRPRATTGSRLGRIVREFVRGP